MTRQRRSPDRRSSTRRISVFASLRARLGRAFDIGLILAAAVAVFYLVSTAGKVVSGYTAEEPAPKHRVRLQLIDATRSDDTVRPDAKQIERLSDLELSIEVVEKGSFDLRAVDRSLVISRQKDLTAARLLAARLGLEPSDVEYKPLVNDKNFVDATLIFGSSGITPVAAATNKEN